MRARQPPPCRGEGWSQRRAPARETRVGAHQRALWCLAALDEEASRPLGNDQTPEPRSAEGTACCGAEKTIFKHAALPKRGSRAKWDRFLVLVAHSESLRKSHHSGSDPTSAGRSALVVRALLHRTAKRQGDHKISPQPFKPISTIHVPVQNRPFFTRFNAFRHCWDQRAGGGPGCPDV